MPAAVPTCPAGDLHAPAGAKGEPSLNGDRSRDTAEVGDCDRAMFAVLSRSDTKFRCGESRFEDVLVVAGVEL